MTCIKHSCRVEGSFWLIYFTCRNCGEVRAVDRDHLYALLVGVQS